VRWTRRTGPATTTAIDRRDELIGRVIDGEASERDWSSLRTLAGGPVACGPT
jgi:hypothetical protein